MNITPEIRSIPVVVDKSHLVTIGEKLYTDKMAFVRELVNNAYDADATEVYVEIHPLAITIRDNGSGMDEEGLRQYFTIGSTLKKSESKSKLFDRKRIGEFGIGKFAALAASKKFEVETQKGDFHASLVFDKEAWSRHEDWHLDITILPPSVDQGNGTIITLHHPNVSFMLGKVRRYLSERTPIHVSNFAVFLNGDRVSDDITAGRQLPIHIQTPHGPIDGMIVITPTDNRAKQLGIAVKVKGVLVRYENFGLETSRKLGVTRITGKVNADFLPITSGRDDFIRDSEEFNAFWESMKKEIGKALGIIREEGDRRANIQASRILKDALSKIGRAMKGHKDLFPEAHVALGVPTSPDDPEAQKGYVISEAEFLPSGNELDPDLQKKMDENQEKKKGKGRPRGILGNKSVIRTLHVADMDVAVRMEHLGNDVESLISGGVIYVNLDHPLYRTYQNNDDILTLHVSRIITKELALQTGITSAQAAFDLQADLLTDAFKGKGM